MQESKFSLSLKDISPHAKALPMLKNKNNAKSISFILFPYIKLKA
jgi:hypothetical protein